MGKEGYRQEGLIKGKGKGKGKGYGTKLDMNLARPLSLF